VLYDKKTGSRLDIAGIALQQKQAAEEQKRIAEAERQAELERQQEEIWANIAQTANQLAAGIAQQRQSQSGGNTGGSGGQSQTGTSRGGSSSSSSSGGKSNNANATSMLQNYNSRAKTTEDVYFQLQRATTAAEIDRLSGVLKSHQSDLKTYRENCKKNGVDIAPSIYETKWPW